MTAPALLAQLRDLGVTARPDGDMLRLRPAAAVPPALLAEVKAHKAELLALLAVNDAAPLLPPASPEQAEAERQDRAAIAEVDGGTDPARWRLTDHMRHAAILRGLQAAALQRPPSWSDPAAAPSPGCWCSCCRGSRWWCEGMAPSGWRCWTCHPPVPGANVTEVRT